MSEALNPTYEDIQGQAKGSGVEEWKRADKARAGLPEYYRELQDDPRITDLVRSEKAWERYEAVKAQVEADSTKARELSERSARTAERQSIPMPDGEPLITTDSDKLLLTQGEHNRINRLIDRKSSRATKATPFSPGKFLKEEFARGREIAGMRGGAICRAVVEIAQEGFPSEDIHSIVDEHRKPYQRQALEDAQGGYMRQQLIGKSVGKPPFPRPEQIQQGGKGVGTYRGPQKTLMPDGPGAQKPKLFQGNRRRSHWK
jgi:hypothetical protein